MDCCGIIKNSKLFLGKKRNHPVEYPFRIIAFFRREIHGIIKNNKLFLGKTSFGYPAEQRVVLPVFFQCEIHGIIYAESLA